MPGSKSPVERISETIQVLSVVVGVVISVLSFNAARESEEQDNQKLNFSVDDKVKVYGTLQGGRKRIFDGYVIKKPTGEQIIESSPTSHFGFVIQSFFE